MAAVFDELHAWRRRKLEPLPGMPVERDSEEGIARVLAGDAFEQQPGTPMTGEPIFVLHPDRDAGFLLLVLRRLVLGCAASKYPDVTTRGSISVPAWSYCTPGAASGAARVEVATSAREEPDALSKDLNVVLARREVRFPNSRARRRPAPASVFNGIDDDDDDSSLEPIIDLQRRARDGSSSWMSFSVTLTLTWHLGRDWGRARGIRGPGPAPASSRPGQGPIPARARIIRIEDGARSDQAMFGRRGRRCRTAP